MAKKLKDDEEWALNLLKPLNDKRYPNGYSISVPENDPPDCILEPEDKFDSPTRIEFSALGPKKYFEFVAVMLKKRTPFFAELQIPYEPEAWLQEVIDRKNFPENSRFDILCTHFCSHFTLPGFKQKGRHQNQDTNPFKITRDMLNRFYRVTWDNQNDHINPKPIVIVQPGSNPCGLTLVNEPPRVPDIDISKGFPTIQMRVSNLPNGENIKWDKIENLSRVFKPYNRNWKTPDIFRHAKPIPEGYSCSIVHRTGTKDKLIVGSLVMTVEMSMPTIE